MIFIFFIAYITNRAPQIAIMLSLAFMVTLMVVNSSVKKFNEHFDEEDENYGIIPQLAKAN